VRALAASFSVFTFDPAKLLRDQSLNADILFM